jgi:hypothetical protein
MSIKGLIGSIITTEKLKESIMELDSYLYALDLNELRNFLSDFYTPWADWTPTLSWLGGTPSTNISTVARYSRIGKVIKFKFYFKASDANGVTDLTITMPTSPKNNSGKTVFTSMLVFGGTLSGEYNPLAYNVDSESIIRFNDFYPSIDDNSIELSISGEYEID